MALIQYVQASQLESIAETMGRASQFSSQAWEMLGEHIEESSEDDVEVDIVAICCEYDEISSVEEFWEQYSHLMESYAEEWPEMDNEEKLEAIRGILEDETTVVCCEEDCILFVAF